MSRPNLLSLLIALFTGWGIALTAPVVLLSGCIVDTDYDDDDDDFNCDDDNRFDDDDDDFDADDDGGFNCDDNDDDDNGRLSEDVELSDGFELLQYELIAGVDPARHPVRTLADIAGLSIFGAFGPGEFGEEEFHDYTLAVIAANPELLGLADTAGKLRFEGFVTFESALAVTFQQVWPAADGQGTEIVAPDGLLVFVFDLLGKLQQIDNTTWLALPESSDSAPDAETSQDATGDSD